MFFVPTCGVQDEPRPRIGFRIRVSEFSDYVGSMVRQGTAFYEVQLRDQRTGL